MRSTSLGSLALGALLLAGCKTMPPFLGDYSQLAREDEALWTWLADDLPERAYERFLIGRVSSQLPALEFGGRLNHFCAVSLHKTLSQKTAQAFGAPDGAGERVLRVRARITPFQGSGLRSALPEIGPHGGAALETVVEDSLTGEALAHFVQPSWDPFFRNPGPDADLRSGRVIAAWVERLLPELDQLVAPASAP